MNYLTVALSKGRLAEESMKVFARAGVTCQEMAEPSRKLIFLNEELKMKFFLAKASDVPTYVEYGAADLGVAGKDTLLEENRRVNEVADFGFGRCQVVVAGPPEKAALLESAVTLRVATKYPHIARDYFQGQRRRTVEIIKLNGSVELAPVVGLADVIVDIVETGSTLRENGLVILEEICQISARLVANRVSMKLESERIHQLVHAVKEALV